ncbi:reverse transcriptase [Gossypium australe]|uniref:Reverse transcriptase n=1 Tax=Gossypium australe TaxID=47621 RepID=A0A5B6VIN8_9ROSI|nr:reverse transcriptase [Gossypium australe]
MEKVRLKCGFENGIDIGAIGSRGGLSLGWKGNSLVSLKSFSSLHIDVEIQDTTCATKWRFTGFYENPIEQQRRESWNLLRHLNGDCNVAWIVMGDFNEILSSYEKKGGRLRLERQMQDFRMALEDCNLFDLGFVGRWFTWERGRFKNSNIRERLDRGVANSEWMDLFPDYQIEHLSHSFSDHCPLLLDTKGEGRMHIRQNARMFRFEFNWLLDSSFEDQVRSWWEGSAESIPNKLQLLRHNLLQWSRVKRKEEGHSRVQLEKKLESFVSCDILDDVLAEIMEVQLALNLEADKEEMYWEQRARVNWLQNGDRNTSFFHKMASQRHSRNKISELFDNNGIRHTDSVAMLKVASDYFGDLFTASEEGPDEHLFNLVVKKVSNAMNDSLLRPFTEEEVWSVVSSMPPLKAPGEDGFPTIFFQRFWHIVGSEVSKFCLDVLGGREELGAINRTRIVLIPKVDKPKMISQFRPISLCNVIYKIISKMLVNRMSIFLGDCINEAQGAFIPGRCISDNVLIAYEVLHSLKMKKGGRKGHFALKVDMSKAYDRVEWDFIGGMMKALGFHEDWIVLVLRCISSISYSVSLNGEESESIWPSRGLRQGDPLSPYLFLICAEGFSVLLEEAQRRGSMKGAPIGREKIYINHLFFADDCILFGDATREGAVAVREVLQEYELCAGQKVNYDKSLVYYGANVSDEAREDIANFLGVRVASNPEKYLGLPMMVGRRKTWAFAEFIDRFRKRVDGWSYRCLSMGGKEVFIKSVLQATPLYAMQCFLFPKMLCRKLENIMNKFWWRNNKKSKGIHWSCWDTLCKPKSDRGMGFKNLILFNKALLAKQVWRILVQPNCLLARILKARYFPHTDILSAKVGSYPSFTWRSICNSRDLIADGMLWRIGQGSSVNIWDDPWLPGKDNNRVTDESSSTWKSELIYRLVDKATVDRILSIPLASRRMEDALVWKYDGSGEYSVKSGYRALMTTAISPMPNCAIEGTYNSFYKLLWALKLPGKVKIHVWRLFNNLLPHASNLARRMVITETACPLCRAELEDSNHLMWSCGVLQSVWTHLLVPIPVIEETWDHHKRLAHMFVNIEEQHRSIVAISFWSLWYRRNKLIHEGTRFNLQEVIGFIRGYINELNTLQRSVQPSIRPGPKELWRPPEEGKIKVNFDASYRSDGNMAFTAVIARDASGIIQGAGTYLFTQVVYPFVAEARACERALSFTLSLGFTRLEVEGDSLTVIKSIEKKENDRSVLRPITQHIRHLGSSFEEITYRHVWRSANGVAHTLALEGRRRNHSGIWNWELPASVLRLAEQDRVVGR